MMKKLTAILVLLCLPLAAQALPDATLYMVHNDHLGTPKAMTDMDGDVVWRAQADPFGQTQVREDVDGNGEMVTLNVRFPGQYFDPESGLHYNYFRYYDPETGRYVASDPIGLLAGVNTYGYVLGNPLVNFDFFGLDCVYSISGGTMKCTNSAGDITHESSGWVSGQGGACQNNPSAECVSWKDEGPLPQGDYNSTGVPKHRVGTSTTRRSLEPDPSNEMYGRGTFQTHFCPDEQTCSNGCPSNVDWEVITNWNDYLDENPNEPIVVMD